MNYITYSLISKDINSNQYYTRVEKLSGKIIKSVLSSSEEYLNEFITFIEKYELEKVRSKEEYGIEVLLIGVLIKEYLQNGFAFRYSSKNVFKVLNKLRKNDFFKVKIDNIRGKLATNILMRRESGNIDIDFKTFKLLIRWLEATGDFNEEVYRLNNWVNFLDNKDKKYIDNFLNISISNSDHLYNQGKKYLCEYTINVEEYLNSYINNHINKEDIIYCGKGEIQYFFNMIAAEIMNKTYRNDFLTCDIKKVFLPACMRQVKKNCLSEKSNSGYVCKSCSKECNVRKLKEIGLKNNFEVYIIPHETMLFNSSQSENSNIGIVGVACVLNLVSGGWKALRLGFKPQCVVLDYCGCDKHWLEKSVMTSINLDRVKSIINIK